MGVTNKEVIISYKQKRNNKYGSEIIEYFTNRKDGLTRYLNILNGEFPVSGEESICSLKYFENNIDMTSRINRFLIGYNLF